MTETSATAEIHYLSVQTWKGKAVPVEGIALDQGGPVALCQPEQHDLSVMHHFGEDGKHYCPTGFLMCSICGGMADEPEPYECLLWGERE